MSPDPKYRVPDRGSAIVRTLEAAWKRLQKLDARIPLVVLSLVDARSRRSVQGYFASESWQQRRGQTAHEVAISPELIGHPREILATMLHEAAHAILFEAGNNGGMSSPYYHTRVFRDQCVEFGLACQFRNTRYGWCITHWPDDRSPPARYRDVMTILRGAMPAGTGGPRKDGRLPPKKLPPSGQVRLVCGCDDAARRVYAPLSVAQVGGIFCELCGHKFQGVERRKRNGK